MTPLHDPREDYARPMRVALLHDGGEATRIAEARLIAAHHEIVPAAEGEVILLLLPSARAAAEALAQSPPAKARCLVDLCELHLDEIAGTTPLLEAGWTEHPEGRRIMVSGPEAAYQAAYPVLDAIAPTAHFPDGHGFRRVLAIDGRLHERWLTERITLEEVERRISVRLENEGVAWEWQEAMTNQAMRLSFPHRPWAEAAIAATLREKSVVFGFLFLEWQVLKRKMLDGDELWRFDSGAQTWASLMGRAGIALVRRGKVLGWIDEMMN